MNSKLLHHILLLLLLALPDLSYSQILFQEDFSNGHKNWTVKIWDNTDAAPVAVQKLSVNESHWLKAPRKGCFYPKMATPLPEVFTMEYDLWADAEKMSEMEGGLSCILIDSKASRADYDYHFGTASQIKLDVHPSERLLYLSAHREYGNENYEVFNERLEGKWKMNKVNKVKIERNKTQITVAVNGELLMQLPNALKAGKTYHLLFATNLSGDGMYVSNIVIRQ